jgi:hypothetical protein
MTEGEWRAALSPISPLDWLFFETPASDRKLRLFSVACCRRARHLIQHPSALRLLDLSEAFAEGQIDEVALRVANRDEIQRLNLSITPGTLIPGGVAAADGACIFASADVEADRDRRRYERDRLLPRCVRVAWLVLEARAPAGQAKVHASRMTELRDQMRLLHDIFGPLPVCDITVAPEWLTSDVLMLVRGIDEENAFDRLPILADALQDAGCTNDDILNHCRARSWEHVRGCWVIDLLLGRSWREPA